MFVSVWFLLAWWELIHESLSVKVYVSCFLINVVMSSACSILINVILIVVVCGEGMGVVSSVRLKWLNNFLIICFSQ